ncbi:MAG: glucose 1-dehydrogenase [Thaumarchaeota archaeon]|nr:glucose 1-dehydrogenase [Nitrososphaerota archaeon]
MTGRLEGKVALITGSSRGIGRATAQLFAEEGAKICVNYNNAEEEAANVVRGIEGSGGEAMAIRADVANEKEVIAMVEAAIRRFGRIDVLVNNAGIMMRGDLFDVKSEDLDAMFGVNVKGVIYCTREVGRHMLEQKYGKVVNVGSNAGLGTAFKGTTGYGLTKAAVMLLTKRFALDFKGAGVTVNCVSPGYTETEMTTRGKTQKQFEEAVADVSTRAMLGRVAKPIEIARAILFLASDDSSFSTGATLMADGGRMDFLTHGF